MTTKFTLFYSIALCIAPGLLAMQYENRSNQAITLIANDGKTKVAISAASLATSPIVKSLLEMSIANDIRNNSFCCSFVNAHGLPYVKRILDDKASETQDPSIIKDLISKETIETIYGVHQHLDCWQIPLQTCSLDMELNKLSHIKKTIITRDNKCIFAITLDGDCFMVDINNEKIQKIHSSGMLGGSSHYFLSALTLNPRADTVYFGGLEEILHIWNSKSETLKNISCKRKIHDILISPDESFVIIADDCWFTICDSHFNQKKELLRYINSPILITPDSKFIIYAHNDIRAWNNTHLYIANNDGSPYKEIYISKDRIKHIAFADNGNIVVASTAHETVLFDLELNRLAQLPKNSEPTTFMNTYSDYIIVGDESGKITLWKFDPKTNTIQSITTIHDHTDEIKNIVFSPNGRHFACAGADRKVCLYNLHGTLINSWIACKSDCRSKINITFSPDGLTLLLSGYFGAIVCDISAVSKISEFQQLPSLLQKKILHEIKGIEALNGQEKNAKATALCSDLEQLGFHIPEIKAYINSI